ncbi:MAG TPA: DUF4845 domain-containing protein [Terriglobales bacterium]|jgi:hypothetical protein
METSKLIFGLVIVGLVIYLGIEVVPAYYANYEFQDAISRAALDNTYRSATEDDIQAQLMKSAKEYDVPITAEDIKVVRTGYVGGAGAVSIDVNYTVHVPLPVYSLDLHFNPSSTNKGLY